MADLEWSRLSLANQNHNFFSIVQDQNHGIFPVGRFFHDFNAFYKQRLNCVFTVHAICTAHDYLITVTQTLHLSAKKHIIMCLNDKRLLLFTAIVTATIFVYE